jgi:creatine kinase
MHNEHLGYILTSPADLGTGLRASVLVKLPLLSQRADFKSLCGGMRLEARGGAGEGSEASDGVYDISNSDRLGKSEVALVELMINGCTKLIELEQKLERGEAI